MKTKEELNNLKQEFETLNKKLRELTEDELKIVTGGVLNRPDTPSDCNFFEDEATGGKWCTAPAWIRGTTEWCASCEGKPKLY